MTWNDNLLLSLMVLWVDWGSAGHPSFGVSHVVAAISAGLQSKEGSVGSAVQDGWQLMLTVSWEF